MQLTHFKLNRAYFHLFFSKIIHVLFVCAIVSSTACTMRTFKIDVKQLHHKYRHMDFIRENDFKSVFIIINPYPKNGLIFYCNSSWLCSTSVQRKSTETSSRQNFYTLTSQNIFHDRQQIRGQIHIKKWCFLDKCIYTVLLNLSQDMMNHLLSVNSCLVFKQN